MVGSTAGTRNTQDEPGASLVPESKKVLRKQKDGACQRDTGASLKELPTAKAGTIGTTK